MSGGSDATEKIPLPRHLFIHDHRAHTLNKSPAVLIATGSLDFTQPLVPQGQERLQALQTPTSLNPAPTPIEHIMTHTDLLEGLLEANKMAILQGYQQEIQCSRRLITRLHDELEATRTHLRDVQARLDRVKGFLLRMLNGISETVLSSWSLPVADVAYIRY